MNFNMNFGSHHEFARDFFTSPCNDPLLFSRREEMRINYERGVYDNPAFSMSISSRTGSMSMRDVWVAT